MLTIASIRCTQSDQYGDSVALLFLFSTSPCFVFNPVECSPYLIHMATGSQRLVQQT